MLCPGLRATSALLPNSWVGGCCCPVFAVRGSLSYVPALRCAPCRTSYERPAFVGAFSSSLRSSSTRTSGCGCRSVGSVRRVGGVKVKVKCASGGPAQRAGGRSRCLAADRFVGGGVRSGVLPSPGTGGNQEPAGTATGDSFGRARFPFRRLHSRQNPGRAAPARRREHPDLAGSARSAPGPTPQSHRDISHRTPRPRPTGEILHQASARAARFPMNVHAGRFAGRFCIGRRGSN